MIPLPPGVLARNDQDQAALRDLTRRAHIHRDCPLPDVCAIADITRHLMAQIYSDAGTVRDLARILAVAATERSRLLTPQQILGLDTPAVPAPPGSQASHEQTADAIAAHAERLPQPGRAAIVAVITVHIASPAAGPDAECPSCEGAGTYFDDEIGHSLHCHCGCPWCVGCSEPVCDGPCETVEAIADALHIGAGHG